MSVGRRDFSGSFPVESPWCLEFPFDLTLPIPGDNSFFCSHNRGYIYFTEILRGCNEICDFRGFLCESEADAVHGTCSNETVPVCQYIRTQEAVADQAERSISILTFETDMDKLYWRCNEDKD